MISISHTLTVAVVTVLAAVVPLPSQAADPAPSNQISDHEQRIKELEDEVKRLKKDERQLEVTVENQKPLAGWSDGFFLASQDGTYKLKIGGYTQLDGREETPRRGVKACWP